MKRMGLVVATCLIVWLVAFQVPVVGEDEAFQLEIEGSRAKVTELEGQAQVRHAGRDAWETLRAGDALVHGDTVRTREGARMELALPDGSVVRFDEATTFEIVRLDVNTEPREREVRFDLLAGKAWATVKSLTGGKRNFELYTQNAVAGVRGTVYRVTEDKKKGTLVRVYQGEVQVRSLPRQARAGRAGSAPGNTATVPTPHGVGAPGEVPAPRAVSGPGTVGPPREVPPPREITMMEWVYLIRSMQQITISPAGVPSKPRTFTEQEDRSDWVEWNRKRDRALGR